MWRWRRVAVARVFALVVRCGIMMLFVYSRVGKNRDTSGGPRREPGQAVAQAIKPSFVNQLSRHGAPMTYTDLLPTVLFNQVAVKVLNAHQTPYE